VRLKADMVTFDGEPRDVTPAGHYFEGPFMTKHAGKYFLMYSYGKTVTDTYSVYYAVGDTPLGPFVEPSSEPILSTDKSRDVVSPGHHAVFSRDGRTYILYHRHSVPYIPEQAYRQTCIDELDFTRDNLLARVTPTHEAPDFVSGRESSTLPATATASSQLDELHGAGRVLDDNYATRWSAAPRDKTSWLQLDLGAVRQVNRSDLRFEYAWKSYRFALETSTDGLTWTSLVDHLAGGLVGSPFALL
jgi:beta-xylosidase